MNQAFIFTRDDSSVALLCFRDNTARKLLSTKRRSEVIIFPHLWSNLASLILWLP